MNVFDATKETKSAHRLCLEKSWNLVTRKTEGMAAMLSKFAVIIAFLD